MEMRAVNEDANQSLVAGENSNSYGATDKGPVYKVCCDVNHQSPEPINLPNAVVITVGTKAVETYGFLYVGWPYQILGDGPR